MTVYNLVFAREMDETGYVWECTNGFYERADAVEEAACYERAIVLPVSGDYDHMEVCQGVYTATMGIPSMMHARLAATEYLAGMNI